MRVHLGGHLNWYDAEKRAWLLQRQSEPITLLALAQQLGLPAAEIAIAAVNGRAVALETTVVTDSDCEARLPHLRLLKKLSDCNMKTP